MPREPTPPQMGRYGGNLGFPRSPTAIVLAVVSAILILVGRVNHRETWGTPVAIVGYLLLALAAVVQFARMRKS